MNNKKKLLALCILAFMLITYGVYKLGVFKFNTEKEFTIIDFKRMETILQNKETNSIIYCGENTCGACRSFTPLVKKVAKKKNVEIYYLDLDIISNQSDINKYNISETPTLIVTTNGRTIIYRGTLEEEDLEKIFSHQESNLIELSEKKDINFEELEDLLKKNTDFILYIGRDDCSDCQMFNEYLEEYYDNNSNGMYYLNIKEYRQLALKENADPNDIKFFDNIMSLFNIEWVPTCIHIRNGVEVSRFQYLDKNYSELTQKEKLLKKQEIEDNFNRWILESSYKK